MDKQTIKMIKDVIIFLEEVKKLKKMKKKIIPEFEEKKKSSKKQLEELWFNQNCEEIEYEEAIKQKRWRSYIKNNYVEVEYPPL